MDPFEETSSEIELFHNRCLRSCLVISITTQWENHISNETIKQRWGDPDTINIKLIRQRMQWLAQMPSHRIPKMCFCGWLSQGGPKKRWKDIIRKKIIDLNIPESCWYDLANINQDLPGETITMSVWGLVKCHLAKLIYKLLSALNATEVSGALAT